MEVTRLRTMTMKSRFDAGKYQGQTVQVIVDVDPDYILFEYYNLSKISFTDDVLTAVGITEQYRIEKPGKNDKVKHQLYLDRIQAMSQEQRNDYLIKQGRKKKLKEQRVNKFHERADSFVLNKARLKAINQSNTKLNFTFRSTDGLNAINTNRKNKV